MRVLLIDVCCKIGSTGKIVYDLYSHVNQQGDEAAICYGRGKKIREKNIYKFGFDWETFIHALLTRITGYTGCFSYFSTKRLIKFIKKFKPDVVHIHELHAYFVNISMLLNFLKKLDIKVVHTLHCAFSYTGKCGHHLDCTNWKNNCGNCPRLNEYVSTFWFDRTKSMFAKKKKAFSGFADMTIVCPSNWLAYYAKQSFLGEYPIEIIHNGIDTNVFHYTNPLHLKKKLNINEKDKVILSVAPNLMSDSKGGKWILKLAEMLEQNSIKFIMIGVDDDISITNNNVIAFKRTNNQNILADFYSIADLFIICSQMENFPTTCLEAQCCGAPIVGFDTGGTKETIILDGKFLAKYGDCEELKQIILDNISLRNENHLIDRIAQDRYSKKNMNSCYYEIYKKIR